MFNEPLLRITVDGNPKNAHSDTVRLPTLLMPSNTLLPVMVRFRIMTVASPSTTMLGAPPNAACNVIRPLPSRIVLSKKLSGSPVLIGIVTGPGPQLTNTRPPPAARAAHNSNWIASLVQLAGVPSPTTNICNAGSACG